MAQVDAGFSGDLTALLDQILLEQTGKTATVVQGRHYSEKLAVEVTDDIS
jgi:hypothetical protein